MQRVTNTISPSERAVGAVWGTNSNGCSPWKITVPITYLPLDGDKIANLGSIMPHLLRFQMKLSAKALLQLRNTETTGNANCDDNQCDGNC